MRRRACGLLPLPAMLLLLPTACAAPPALPPRQAALGTPAARVAAESFAAVLDPAGGAPVGGAVAIGPRHVLTSAHVACDAAAASDGQIRLQQGDGATEAEAAVLAVSDRLDLAVLVTPGGFLAAPPQAAAMPPRLGDPVWAVGPHRLGRAVAVGSVMSPPRLLPGSGPGFVARLPALMGYSGGPVVDREGSLVGIVTAAMQETLAVELAALLTGVDLGGLAFGAERRVFILSADAVLAEAQRLLAGDAPHSSASAWRAGCRPGP
jgi:S1-C subfamily serine protease